MLKTQKSIKQIKRAPEVGGTSAPRGSLES